MNIDRDDETRPKFNEFDERPVNFAWWLLACAISSAIWFGLWRLLSWLLGAM